MCINGSARQNLQSKLKPCSQNLDSHTFNISTPNVCVRFAEISITYVQSYCIDLYLYGYHQEMLVICF